MKATELREKTAQQLNEQLLGLLLQGFGSRRGFFDEGGILLGDFVHLGYGQ